MKTKMKSVYTNLTLFNSNMNSSYVAFPASSDEFMLESSISHVLCVTNITYVELGVRLRWGLVRRPQ